MKKVAFLLSVGLLSFSFTGSAAYAGRFDQILKDVAIVKSDLQRYQKPESRWANCDTIYAVIALIQDQPDLKERQSKLEQEFYFLSLYCRFSNREYNPDHQEWNHEQRLQKASESSSSLEAKLTAWSDEDLVMPASRINHEFSSEDVRVLSTP